MFSVGCRAIQPTASTGASTKAAINAYTQGAAIGNARYGVRVNCIMPGMMNTPMAVDGNLAVRPDLDRDQLVALRDAGVPLRGKMGTGWDTAYAALYLASDESKFVTGAELVIVTVPYAGHAELLGELADALAGKIVVDCVNPLGFDKQGPYALDVEEGSATQQAAAILTESRVTGAFHHVSAVLLEDPEVERVDTDVLVLGDDREATDVVRALADAVPGMRGVYAGRLRNAHQVEALTANLISVNRRYKAHSGLRVTDL